MANLLQSSQNKSTEAPAYYNQYLQCLATQGTQAVKDTQFVGAQPLQTEAFCKVATNFGAQQPAYKTGMGYIGCAAAQNITGASSPFLKAGTSASPLCAAKPLICKSANLNLGCVAQSYMNPYINSAVNQMSDIANRNIQQNLNPMATAAAVGSGQFGSQRGAQVLGQVNANAMQDLNSQIANMLSSGYGQALCAAKAKESALGQLAGTTATAQQAQNQAQLQAAQTAACSAARQAQTEQAAGLGMGTLATQAAGQNLACINALATLGAQCQTIKQNAQCFNFNKLGKLSSLMQGQAIPTSVKTTMCASPLSTISTLLSAGKASGVLCKGIDYATKAFCKLFGSCGCAEGGSVKAAGGGSIGCASTRNLGALPVGRT